jgi:hypothetical protein
MKCRKKIIQAVLGVMALFSISCAAKTESVQAGESVEFYVQTAEENEDGTIRTVVYVSNTADLGGVDVELVYDADKVSYVGSGLGTAFDISLGTTNPIEDESLVKCVAVFGEMNITSGELFYADFKPSAGESYQPKLNVVDVLDSTTDVNPLSYSVTYQQADGNWLDTPDEGGEKADEKVIEAAKEKYGSGDATFTGDSVVSDELQKTAGDVSDTAGDKTSEAASGESEATTDEESGTSGDDSDNTSDKNSGETSDEGNETESESAVENETAESVSEGSESDAATVESGTDEENADKDSATTNKSAVWIIVIVIIAVVLVVAVVIVKKKSGGKNDEK